MSGRFHFELEPVLEQRARVERLRQQRVATLEAQRLGVEDRIRGVQASLSRDRQALRDLLRPGAGKGEALTPVRLAARGSLLALQQLQAAAIELAGVHQQLHSARKQLLDAAVARKAVEMLKAKRRAAWVRERNRLETLELDDLTVMRHARDAETRA